MKPQLDCFEPPVGWRQSRLGEEFTLQRGFDITVAEQKPGKIPVVSSSGITSYHNQAMVAGPGVVIGRKGKLGNAYYVGVSFWPHDTSLWVKDFHGNDPRFGATFLRWLRLERFDAATSVPTLNRNFVHPLLVKIPPLSEQQKIADVLDTLDATIRKTEQLIAKLEQVKQGLLHDLLTRGIDDNGELRDPDRHPEQFKDSVLGRKPREWAVRQLNDVLDSIDAGKSPSCPDQPAAPGEWGVLKVSAVRPEGFRSAENKVLTNTTFVNPAYEVRDGDLLITRANTSELVGLVCLVKRPPPRLLLCDKTLRLNVDSTADERFVFFSTQMPYMRRQIEMHATGSSGSMKNITQDIIRRLKLATPKKPEQIMVSDRFEAADERLRSEHIQARKLRLLKQGLMDDLLTGRVRVTHLLDEPQ